MKINEVEQLVGITKKNIRFYEEQGLLTPRRSENGYRDYGEAELETLRRIKLLRKLGFPLEEIRQLQRGRETVGDGMRRQLITLARQRENLETTAALCTELADCREKLEQLDAAALLARMEQMEQEGSTFMDKQKHDTRRRYIAPTVAALVMAALMLGTIALLLWAFRVDPVGAPPLPLLILILAIPAAVTVGVSMALILRLRELRRNELDDAKDY